MSKNYLSVVVIAVLYSALFFLAWQNWQLCAWFGLGIALGLSLMWLDEHVFYRWYVSETPASLELITRSPLFLAIYAPLAFLAITSTVNLVGIGLILAIGLTVVVEAWVLQAQPERFKKRFLQHLSRRITNRQITQLILIGTAVFVALSLITWW